MAHVQICATLTHRNFLIFGSAEVASRLLVWLVFELLVNARTNSGTRGEPVCVNSLRKKDSKMASLSNPKLEITLVAGTSNVKVEASVIVGFNLFELNQINLGLRGRLHCELWGEDGTVFNGGDDDLVSFGTRTLATSGLQTFSATLPSSMLDEDIGADEIYALFTLSSNEASFSFNLPPKRSPTKTGAF